MNPPRGVTHQVAEASLPTLAKNARMGHPRRYWCQPELGHPAIIMIEPAIRAYVLAAVADDYESVETIIGEVVAWGVKGGVAVDRENLIEALGELVAEGWVSAYLLSAQKAKAEPVPFDRARVEELWFYISPLGRTKLLDMRSQWDP
jgi:hypothetical protein